MERDEIEKSDEALLLEEYAGLENAWIEYINSDGENFLKFLKEDFKKRGIVITASKLTNKLVFAVSESGRMNLGDDLFLNGIAFITSGLGLVEEIYEKNKSGVPRFEAEQTFVDNAYGRNFFTQALEMIKQGKKYSEILDWMVQGVESGEFAPTVGFSMSSSERIMPFMREIFVRGAKCGVSLYKTVYPKAESIARVN